MLIILHCFIELTLMLRYGMLMHSFLPPQCNV